MSTAELTRIASSIGDLAIIARLAHELADECMTGRPQRLEEVSALLRVLGPKAREALREVDDLLFAQEQTERVISGPASR
jgi:hypothetical protein